MKRGIVATPGILHKLPQGIQMERSLNFDELKYYILYFNKVVIPSNNGLYIGLPNEKELIESNLIKRPNYNVSGLIDYALLTKIQTTELERLQKINDNTYWNLHQIGGDSIIASNEDLVRKETIKFKLLNVLPVPSEDVSIDELSIFKEKRSDEFNSLHETIDNLYLDILKSPDQVFSERKIIIQLQNDIGNIQKVSSEKWKIFKGYSLDYDFTIATELSTSGLIAGGGAGYVFDQALFGTTFPIGTIIGAAVKGIDIKVLPSMTLKKETPNHQLSYISHGIKNGIIKTV